MQKNIRTNVILNMFFLVKIVWYQ